MSAPAAGLLYVVAADPGAEAAAPAVIAAAQRALGRDAVFSDPDSPLGGAGDAEALLALDAGDAALVVATAPDALERLAAAAGSLQQTQRVRYAVAPLDAAQLSDAALSGFGDALVAVAATGSSGTLDADALGAAARDALSAAREAAAKSRAPTRGTESRRAAWRERCGLRAAGDDLGALARHAARYPDTAPFALSRFDAGLERLIGPANARSLRDEALAAAVDLPPGAPDEELVAPLAARTGRNAAGLWRAGARRRRLEVARFPVLVDHLPELRKILYYATLAIALVVAAALFFG